MKITIETKECQMSQENSRPGGMTIEDARKFLESFFPVIYQVETGTEYKKDPALKPASKKKHPAADF